MLPNFPNVSMTMLPELGNMTLIPSAETSADCAPAPPWVTTPPGHSNTTCPGVPTPPSAPGDSGLGIPFIIQCVIGVCIILANSSILIVLRRCRPAGRTLHYLLQNLAVADLGMAVATFWRLALVARYGQSVEDVPLRCAPVAALFVLSSGVSISFLLLIAIDQWYSAAQNASLELRQRWRRGCRLAVVCTWLVWPSIGLLGFPAIQPAGSYMKSQAPCLVGGGFIHNAYWQVAGLLLIGLGVITVSFQWLSLKAARANTQNLMEALKQRHEGFVLGGKVPSCTSHRLQQPYRRNRTVTSYYSSKVSSKNTTNSVASSYQVSGTEGQSSDKEREPSRNKQSAAVSRKMSRIESFSRMTDSIAAGKKMSLNEHSINGNENQASFNVNLNQFSIKKASVSEKNHPEEGGHGTGNLALSITPKISGSGTMMSSVLGSAYSMNQPGSINRISPIDSEVFSLKGDYYEMKLANTRLQLTRTISIVMAVFVGCWLVYLPFLLIVSACGTPCLGIFNKIAYIGTLAVANSLMNAIIYTFRIKQYRAALRKLFCRVNTREHRASAQLTVNVTTIRELALPPID